MARIFATGAELNSNTEWSSIDNTYASGTQVVESSTSQVRAGGNRSWRVSTTYVDTLGKIVGTYNIPGSPTSISVRFSVYIPTLLDEAQTFDLVRINFGADSYIYFQAFYSSAIDGILFRCRGENTVTGVNSSRLEWGYVLPDRWHEVSIRTTVNTGTGVAEDPIVATLNGVTQTSTSTNWASQGATSLEVGLMDFFGILTDAKEAFFDDIIVDNANVAISDDRYIVKVIPTAVGTNDQWANVGGAADKTTAVTDFSDTTLVRASGTTAQLLQDFHFTDLPVSDTPQYMYSWMRYGNATDTVGLTFSVRDENGNAIT